MDIKNMVISSEKVDQCKFLGLKDCLDQVVYCSEAKLAPIKTTQKISRKGRPYQSNLARLNFINSESNIAWFVELWDNYSNGTIEISSKNNKRFYQFLQEVTNDYNSYKFILNYNDLIEKVNDLTNISFKVKEVTNKNGFISYEPVFIGIC